MFLGREIELKALGRLKKLDKASLVVCRGRRRIGKSTLIEHFSKDLNFLEFQGLPPAEGQVRTAQLDHFSKQLSVNLNLPNMNFSNWSDAFTFLSSQIPKKRTLILLDEISWMSKSEPNFTGYLKIAWDTYFKKHKNLILVLCGSVSSWIDQNILNSTGMMGRVSLTLSPQELSLSDCNRYWNKKPKVSSFEKLKVLSVIGGVPKYLEEIDTSSSAEENIAALCFNPTGFLFDEFNMIFNDIFSRKSATYKKIVLSLVDGRKSLSEICDINNIDNNGTYSNYLSDLESSGFVTRDYIYSVKTAKQSKASYYRLKDNYLRFYLKYIEPRKDQLRKNIYNTNDVEQFLSFDSIMGLQFENLVMSNLNAVIEKIGIGRNSILSASPYFQKKTLRLEALQIDLLIQTKNSLYICEMKFTKKVHASVIDELLLKSKRLKSPKHFSHRYILIYTGELENKSLQEEFFDRLIYFPDMLS